MKIAVIGANGFIGRKILAELNKRSIECIALDINYPEQKSAFSAEWIQLDIYKKHSNTFDSIGRPDVLIYLAWGGLPNYRSLHHFENELPAHYAFLGNALRDGLSSLVITGTCFEYGMQSGSLSESLQTLPDNPYGFAKDTLRRQLEFLKLHKPFALTWTRLFYLYGDGQANNSLWPQLKQAVQKGEKSFPMSGGEQLRDYLPVELAAQYIVTLALCNKDCGIVNICSGKPISVRNLVERWITENNWQIALDFGRYPYPEYEPMAFWGDNRKLMCLISNTDISNTGM